MRDRLKPYFSTLFEAVLNAECRGAGGAILSMDAAMERVAAICHAAHDCGGKLMFVGNGGSMGIATHMAVDFAKTGEMRAMTFSDGAALTCLGNDTGFENVFARQIEWHAREGDVLIAISSSGKSPDILNAVDAARARGVTVITFSGFGANNPLRSKGDLNIYVRSMRYGIVEVAHQAILHAILDLDMGWTPDRAETDSTKEAGETWPVALDA